MNRWMTLRQHGVSLTTGPFGTVLAASDYVHAGVPLINPTHISSGRFVPDPDVSVSATTAARLSRHALKVGDIVVGRHGDVGRSALVGAEQLGWLCGGGSIAIRPGPKIEPRFLQWALTSRHARDQLLAASLGATMDTINEPILMALRVWSPPFDFQRAIADYLDVETARIDALIAKKLRMIELVEERQGAKRDSVVLSAARGNFCSLRWLLRESISDGPHETPEFVDDGVPFLSVDSIVDSRMRFEGCRMISEKDHARYCQKLRPTLGDVLITKAASVGKVALVDDGREFNVWSPLAVLRTDQRVLLPEFLWQYLRTPTAQRRLNLGSTSNTQQNLSMRDLGSIQVPVVSVEIQREVCSQLRSESAAHLNAINSSVALLRERRQALITAAVTGELEVPGVAA